MNEYAAKRFFRPGDRLRTIFASALALLSTLLFCGWAQAAPSTAEQAARVVSGWLRLNAAPLNQAISRQIKEVQSFSDAAGEVMYHVVFLYPKGLVILPADSLVEPIIGFLPEAVAYNPAQSDPLGALVENDVPGRVKLVRQGAPDMSSGVEKASSGAQGKWRRLETASMGLDSPNAAGLASIADVRVAPLVQSTWGQGKAPATTGANCFNLYTPNNYDTGCVATAMAQVMRYWAYPTAGVGTASFTIEVDTVPQAASLRGGNGAGGAYNWSNMPLVPGTPSNAQCQAMGALSYDAGVAVSMSYAAGGSGGNVGTGATALVSTFMYSNAKIGHNADANIPDNFRNQMVNPSLDAGSPTIFAILGSGGGGHAIVCDGYGYDSSTMYHHLNMGWSGADNAWYNLPVYTAGFTYVSIQKVLYNLYITGTGEIVSGRITDQNGLPINGATVTASIGATTYATSTSNAYGIYALPKLPSGNTYTVATSGAGYTFTSQSIPVGTSIDNTTTTGNYWGANFSGIPAVPVMGVGVMIAFALLLALGGMVWRRRQSAGSRSFVTAWFCRH